MRFKSIWVVLFATVLSGCASTRNPKDPFEGFNRAMFSVNDNLDKVALKPLASGYRNVTPSFVQTGVGNFFGNLADVWTAVNNVLQGKVKDGASDVGRVAINSTLGLVGLIDIGSQIGLPKHKEDFGQTLGRWGIAPGPYLVLPLFGSTTLRDTIALPVDLKADIWGYKTPVRWRNTGSVLRLVDARAAVLDASDLIEEAALDRYEFVRDAYLQRRENAVHDGEDAPAKDSKPADGEDSTPKPPTTAAPSSTPAMQQSQADGNGEHQAMLDQSTNALNALNTANWMLAMVNEDELATVQVPDNAVDGDIDILNVAMVAVAAEML